MANNMTQAKEDAIQKIISLSENHNITLDEISSHFIKKSSSSKNSKWLTHLLGYLGAAFIFGGLGLLISMMWDDLNSPARVIITYGPGFIAFLLGIFCVKDTRYEKASTALFLKSAVLLPTGMFVFLTEYTDGDDTQLAAMVVFGILALQFLLTFYSLKRTSLLFFGYLFWNGTMGILMERVGVPGELLGISIGLSIMVTSYLIDKTIHRAIAPFWYFIGSIGLLWSVFDLIEGTLLIDLFFLPMAIGMMLMSVRMHSRTLLITSTFSLLGFLGYYTQEYFADITGWPIALIIMGFLLIGVSAQAIKLGKKIKET